MVGDPLEAVTVGRGEVLVAPVAADDPTVGPSHGVFLVLGGRRSMLATKRDDTYAAGVGAPDPFGSAALGASGRCGSDTGDRLGR